MLAADDSKPSAVMGAAKGADGRAVGAGLRSYYKASLFKLISDLHLVW